MIKLILLFLMMLICSTSFTQKIGDKYKVTIETNMYSEPSSIDGKRYLLPPGTEIEIVQLENNKGYYQVKTPQNGIGYINAVTVNGEYKEFDPKFKEAKTKGEQYKNYKSTRVNQIDDYIKLYGQPTSISEYKTSEYRSKTLIWYCANGKYRSIDFEYIQGNWMKSSEYTSECIR